jgi:peptidoglycan/LPS O-acetylase OafA/YrhL
MEVTMLDDEPDRIFTLSELIPFIGAIVTGAIGGCVACVQHTRSRPETIAAYIIAYAVTGAFGGVMALSAVTVFYPKWITGWGELFLITGIAGLVTALALAAGNLSMRFLLKQIGLEVTVNVARAKKE